MQTDSSASFTCMLCRSASEWTATVFKPISRQARMMRTAISPRLAIKTFLNMGGFFGVRLNFKERLTVFDRMAVGHQSLNNLAAAWRHHVFHDFHRLDGSHRLP